MATQTQARTQASLSKPELAKAISGLVAYDRGHQDSGVRDPQLKTRVRETLRAMPDAERRKAIAQIAIELYLSDEALKTTCGLEDAAALWEWLVFNRMV